MRMEEYKNELLYKYTPEIQPTQIQQNVFSPGHVRTAAVTVTYDRMNQGVVVT